MICLTLSVLPFLSKFPVKAKKESLPKRKEGKNGNGIRKNSHNRRFSNAFINGRLEKLSPTPAGLAILSIVITIYHMILGAFTLSTLFHYFISSFILDYDII